MKAGRRGELAWWIALRYVRSGERSHLVSFMSMLTMTGLALGVAILITVLSVLNGFEQEMRNKVLAILPQATVQSDGGASEGEHQRIGQSLLRHAGVEDVAPLVQEVAVAATDRSSKGVAVAGIDPEAERRISPLDNYTRGPGLAALSTGRFRALIGETLAEQLGVSPGDRFRLYSPSLSVNPLAVLPSQRAFEVAGIFHVGTSELDGEMVVLRADDARALFRVAPADTGWRVRFRDVLAADRVTADLAGTLPSGWRMVPWTEQFGPVYDNILLSRTIIALLLWLLVAVAAFNLVVSLVMIVRDKTGDIAILRTMGAPPGLVARIFLYQGCLIGLVGTAIGMVAGLGLSLTITDLFQWFEQVSGSRLLSAEVYPVDYLPSRIRVTDVVTICIGVALLSLLASVYPARRAARLLPAKALRLD